MRRNDFLFATLLGLPVLTIAAVAMPRPASAVRIVRVAEHVHVHGGSPTPTASAGTPSPAASGTPSGSASASASATPSAAAVQGPFPGDFIDINQVAPNVQQPQRNQNASRGSFVSHCGRDGNKHQNPDNFIVAPGVSNGAHHTHDYVGNLSTDGFSTDQSLQAAGTTCQRGDKSAYFWPVLRIRGQGNDTGQDGNVGTILQPASVRLQFRGNNGAKVAAMPSFLRAITGNAKAASQAGVNANAKWTCTGFEDRTTTKYPLCPGNSKVERILDFPSCWDGTNIDSANHRTHIVFPAAASGICPQGFKPVPQLRMVLAYNVPSAQGRSIALDSFPEELHNPVTDHADFENVMPASLMRHVVTCINRGLRC
ncbi:MAG: hypothetical protein JWN00_6198 [Actinomycetia bacterium]|nr:hypothetical protein [Actinomycetes bacterium]